MFLAPEEPNVYSQRNKFPRDALRRSAMFPEKKLAMFRFSPSEEDF